MQQQLKKNTTQSKLIIMKQQNVNKITEWNKEIKINSQMLRKQNNIK